jgi:hypothetical protein
MKSEKNREAWLTELALQVQPIFRGFRVAPYRVTCGWPSRGAVGLKSRVIGQCHGAQSSKGGFHELFISPVLEEPLQVAGVICHEMAHVVAGVEANHGAGFVKVCKHAGITGSKPKQAMPGPKLNDDLKKMLESMGDYPHAAIVPQFKEVVKPPSSFSLVCSECGCKVTMSAKWIEEVGPPTCFCGGPFELAGG